MTMYLDYATYTSLGGKLTVEDTFNLWNRKAQRKLDYFTQDRLKTATTIIDEVKEVLTDFIDKMESAPSDGNVTSYSDGIESVSFEENQLKALDKELYAMAVEYLPVELISAYVEGSVVISE